MKERGMTFGGEFIPKLLDGSKTQTRRLIKTEMLFLHHDWIPKRNDTSILSFGIYDPERLDLGCFPPVFYPPYGGLGQKKIKVEMSPLEKNENCPCCGYTKEDMGINMDHHLCSVNNIRLEITDVRVERIQDISEEDAKAEGLTTRVDGRMPSGYPASDAFADIWDKIYPGSWEANSWVWVYSFRRIENA